MLKSSNDADWFIVSEQLLERVKESHIPGLKEYRNKFLLHRSALPVFKDDLNVARALTVSDSALNREERYASRNSKTLSSGNFELRKHQHVAVDFMEQRHGTLLADAPRVGKTLSAIMTHDPSRGPLIVFCPMMVREVWLGWLKRAFPGEEISVLQGRTYDEKLTNAPIIIGHYDILKGWQVTKKIGTLIFDEAHVLTNKNGHRTIAANFVAQRAEKVLALTGTPLWNKPIGLFALLNIINQGAWGSYYDFGDRYCAPSPTAFGRNFKGTSNELELMSRLSEVMLHRKHADVASDLPTVTRDVLIVDVSNEQRFEIDMAAEELRGADSLDSTIGALARYRKVLGEIKVDVAVEAAREVLSKGESLVIWAWHKSVARKIYTKLKGKFDAFLITGDPKDGSTKKRDDVLNQWRAATNGVLIITIAVGQVGIDLSHAHICIFAEIDFTPALIAQAEMRTYSPLRNMCSSWLVADHLVERNIVAALQMKLELSDKLGVPAAEASIDVLRAALSEKALPPGDLDRLMADMLMQSYIAG